MKKIILFLGLFGVFAMANAQVDLVSTGNSLTKDTVTNTASKTLAARVNGYRATVTIQVNLTKISGTLAGKVFPVGSNDGTNYYTIAQSSADTLSATDVAAQGMNVACKGGYQYYGVRWTGTGTMSGSFTAKLLARRPND